MYSFKQLAEEKGRWLGPSDKLGQENLQQLQAADRDYITFSGAEGNHLNDFLSKHGEEEASHLVQFHGGDPNGAGLGLVSVEGQELKDKALQALNELDLDSHEGVNTLIQVLRLMGVSLKA